MDSYMYAGVAIETTLKNVQTFIVNKKGVIESAPPPHRPTILSRLLHQEAISKQFVNNYLHLGRENQRHFDDEVPCLITQHACM